MHYSFSCSPVNLGDLLSARFSWRCVSLSRDLGAFHALFSVKCSCRFLLLLLPSTSFFSLLRIILCQSPVSAAKTLDIIYYFSGHRTLRLATFCSLYVFIYEICPTMTHNIVKWTHIHPLRDTWSTLLQPLFSFLPPPPPPPLHLRVSCAPAALCMVTIASFI